jgi:nucleoside-diphosphate-sugar epimerase
MKLFIAGGTGAIGRFAVPALVGAGHEVTAVARSDEKAHGLSAQGAKPVRVSMFDRAALAPLVTGQDAVINIATHIPALRDAARASAWAENDRIRRDGSAALAGAAEAAGVSRYVQESITFPYADRAGAWIDEDAALDVRDAYGTVLDCEDSVRRFTAAGGTGVVLRFAALYGPGAEQVGLLATLARRHVGFLFGRPDGYLSSLHLADAGTAVLAALSAPAGTYNVADDEPVTKARHVEIVAAAVGVRPWVRLPGPLSPLFARGATVGLGRSQRVSNARFRNATGWAPRYPSVAEGWSSPGMPPSETPASESPAGSGEHPRPATSEVGGDDG